MTDMDRLFQKDDRVIGTGICCGVDITGMAGTVVHEPKSESDYIGICFDDYCEVFHGLGGRCAYGHGFWVDDADISLISEEGEWSLDEAHNDLSGLL